MADIYHGKCDSCDYEVEIGWPICACYSQETGHSLAMAQQWIWCSVCGMCIGEYIHPRDHLADLFHMMDRAHARGQWTPDEIAKARQYGAYPRVQNLYTPHGRWTAGDSIAFRNSLEIHRDWRALRQSPARCLQCGSYEFDSLSVDNQYIPTPFAHPNCQGTITVSRSRRGRDSRLLWTTEGLALGTMKPLAPKVSPTKQTTPRATAPNLPPAETFVRRWQEHCERIGQSVGVFSRLPLGDYPITRLDYLWLTAVGLPASSDFFDFDDLTERGLVPVTAIVDSPDDWSEEDRERLQPYLCLGFDGGGNPLCIDVAEEGVRLLDHENEFEPYGTRINSSVRQLAESLLAYSEVMEEWQEQQDATEETNERLANIARERLRSIDAKVMETDGFWNRRIDEEYEFV